MNDEDEFGISPIGAAAGGVVANDIGVNSQQRWNATATAGAPALPALPVLGARPQLTDILTPTQIRSREQGQAGVGIMGAKPGTDIRSAADGGPGSGSVGGMSGRTSEATWRGIFGAKKTSGTVDGQTPRIGMNSVMAAQRYAADLLHSLPPVDTMGTSRSISSRYGTGSESVRSKSFGVPESPLAQPGFNKGAVISSYTPDYTEKGSGSGFIY